MSVEKCSRSRFLRDELLEAGLVDRDLAALEARDLVGVDVDAPDLVAELGEAGGGDEADVAGADDPDGLAFVLMRRERLCGRADAQRGGDREHLLVRQSCAPACCARSRRRACPPGDQAHPRPS